jgi:hypothetical protein
MTPLRKAAQQALEALKLAIGVLSDEDETESNAVRASIKAIKTALEQPEQEQEPVAWMVYTQDGKSVCVTDNPADFTDEHRALPLFTAPPRREWREQCRYPDCVDNGPEGKCIRWLTDECSGPKKGQAEGVEP